MSKVAPLGRVAEPLVVAVWVALFQLVWDCQLPAPPAALVHWPFLETSPWERVVTEDVVPLPPVAVCVGAGPVDLPAVLGARGAGEGEGDAGEDGDGDKLEEGLVFHDNYIG